jgi:NAD(P)-dependent dehydrogenase (short-subunit alcohol dehydrogenase family)
VVAAAWAATPPSIWLGDILFTYRANQKDAESLIREVESVGRKAAGFRPEINKRVAEMTALERAGVPDDIGPMIAALLSDENRWVNGQRIEVSGGMAL